MEIQGNLFETVMPRFRIDKQIRLIELFAGIGSQFAALKRIGADVVSWKMCEIDKYACASFNAVHGTNYEPTDITKIHAEDLEIRERDKYIYILTYSFPCQDLSLAGNRKGYAKGGGTRSGLLWEVERLLDECGENLPHVLLLENVPQVISKSNGNLDNFHMWRRKLESLGYSNYVQLLNAKDYGIPQNRNRCFMVSILGEYYYEFPQKKPLERKLKDMLEDNVDERYYLSDDVVNSFIANSVKQKELGNGFRFDPFERERESSTRNHNESDTDGQRICEGKIGFLDRGTGEHQTNQVFSVDGIARTLQSSLESKSPMKIMMNEKDI